MAYFTTNTYSMKREILTFSNKCSKGLKKPGRKLVADLTYDKFEVLGTIRDGSESTNTKNVIKKGYHVTEACAMTGNGHPISIFSEIHSSKEKEFKSINTVTFAALERGAQLFGKATFVMERGMMTIRCSWNWTK